MLFMPLAGGSPGNDQEQDHEEPARPHQYDEIPISQNRKTMPAPIRPPLGIWRTQVTAIQVRQLMHYGCVPGLSARFLVDHKVMCDRDVHADRIVFPINTHLEPLRVSGVINHATYGSGRLRTLIGRYGADAIPLGIFDDQFEPATHMPFPNSERLYDLPR
jgi:hypothetical protein